MATFRILPAAPALAVKVFATYDEALTYSRANGAHKPLRRLTPDGIRWHVATLAPEIEARPRYVKLPHWTRPPMYDTAARALSHW